MKTVPDKTGKQQGRWLPGQSGNALGRPKGARNRLSEHFLTTFGQDFEQHGIEVIERVRSERPHDYLKIAVTLLPKQAELETHTRPRELCELSNTELMDLLLEGTDKVVDFILEKRGHPTLTPAEQDEIHANDPI
jgi:hypothetical protein